MGIRSDGLSVDLRFPMADGVRYVNDPFTEQVVAFLESLPRS